MALLLGLLAACGDRGGTSPPQEAVFEVRACIGSSAAPQGEVFRILLENSTQIQTAAALLATGSTHVVAGTPRVGDGGFNAPWTWHLDPASVGFPDVTAEVCEGCPHDIESNLNYRLSLGCFAPIGVVIARDR